MRHENRFSARSSINAVATTIGTDRDGDQQLTRVQKMDIINHAMRAAAKSRTLSRRLTVFRK
jgi:hypothetical protein